MKTYLKGDYGATGSMTDRTNGTTRLVIRDSSGRKIHNQIHKNRKAAMNAWYRANR